MKKYTDKVRGELYKVRKIKEMEISTLGSRAQVAFDFEKGLGLLYGKDNKYINQSIFISCEDDIKFNVLSFEHHID